MDNEIKCLCAWVLPPAIGRPWSLEPNLNCPVHGQFHIKNKEPEKPKEPEEKFENFLIDACNDFYIIFGQSEIGVFTCYVFRKGTSLLDGVLGIAKESSPAMAIKEAVSEARRDV